MKVQRKIILLLSTLLALAIGMLPAALASGAFQAEVAVDSMRVYTATAPHTYLGSLPKGTAVTVKAYSNGIALISCGGREGVAKVSDMKAAGKAAAEPEKAADTSSSSKPVIAIRDTRIFSRASVSSSYVTVKAGTTMNLLASNGNCAKVERGGRVGYAVLSHLGEPGSSLQSSEQTETAEKAQAEETPVQSCRVEAVTNRATRIYQQANTSSSYISVEKGTVLTVVALKGNCAKVESGDTVGFTYKSHLSNDRTTVEAAKAAAKEAAEKAAKKKAEEEAKSRNPFPSGSNQAVIFSFLISEMGYNKAAAMGVVSNIKYESSYSPHDVGDGGTSYGICQWHAGRKTSLISWCANHNYDYTTLTGQLYYLKYDLINNYPHVHSYLKQVEDSAQGAYDAGYYFCYHFESPANRGSRSVTRGNYARELYT